VGQRTATVADSGIDPRVSGLVVAVHRLRAELDAYPAQLRDRHAAEDELDALDAKAAEGAPVAAELRTSLLQIVAAVGSVSALSGPVADLRKAVELFGEPVGFRRVN
jgi:hypothetical protein